MDKSNLTIQGEGKQEDIQKIILLYGLIKNRKKQQGFMFQFLKTQNWLSH
jgi:hypothetical protein